MSETNIFANLMKIYKDGVNNADEKGYADTFKKCSELFFQSIAEYCKKFYNETITFEDIEYLDGYFIFGSGTNSVVHFHIKECPGWLFGIWWYMPKEKEPYFTGDFFAQFEKCIDKFKPSASIMGNKFCIYPETGSFACGDGQVLSIIRFINKEPYLAFCRDYLYWDYNMEYHTREEAKQEYEKYLKEQCNETNHTNTK